MGATLFGLPVVTSVFLLMVPESAGILIPSEATLLGAGVAAHAGLTSPLAAILAAALGNLVGAGIAYGLGRRGLLRVRALRGSGVMVRCRALIARRGNAAVFWGRLLPLARTFVSFPAGDARLPAAPFAALTFAGSLLWAVPFVLAGDLAGSAAQRIGGVGGWVTLGAALVALLVLLRPPREERARRTTR